MSTTKTLSGVATDVIHSYGVAATNVINSYRYGGERFFGYVDGRFADAVERGAAALRADLRAGLIDAQQRVSGYYVKGIQFGTDRAHGAVGIAVDLATKGVDLVTANTARFDLDALNRVALPAAQVLSRVAERLEEGSVELVQRVAGKTVPARSIAERKLGATTRQAAAKRRRVTKKVARRVNRAVAGAATETSNAARRTARKARVASQQVGDAVAGAATGASNAARRVARKATAKADAAS